jgi:uncharacterized protein RhaS with RHS repeats
MRDYDPTTGRYLEADPLGLVDGASVYGYARQSPGVYTDVTGQCPFCAAIVLGAAVGAGIDILAQLYTNDGQFNCVDWSEVAKEAAWGAAFGVAGEAYNAYRAAKYADDIARGAAAALAASAERFATNPKIYARLGEQLGRDGAKSIFKALRSAERTLAEHEAKAIKYAAEGGFTSQVQVTIRNVRGQIATIRQFILDNGL